MARDLVLEIIEQVRGNALGDAARDLDKVADRTDAAADSARDYSGDLKILEKQIEATRLKVRSLGAEFVTTQDKATGKDLRGERSLLGQLERIRKELEDAAPDLAPAGAIIGGAMGARAGESFVGTFGDTLAGVSPRLRGALLVGVLGAGVAAAPALGAVIAGAVTGAVGVGGIAGGIAAASREPEVRAAAKAFGQSISEEFFSGGQAFVQPVIESLDILEEAFQDLDLGDSWERVAPFVTRVAEGVAGLGRDFMPGFNRALDRAGPGLEILAQDLPDIGDALGDMIGSIAESDGTLEGWALTLDLVAGTIRATGTAVTWLGDRFQDLMTAAINATGVMEDLPNFKLLAWLTDGGIDMERFNNKLEELRAQAQGAESDLDALTGAGRETSAGLRQQIALASALAIEYRNLSEVYSAFLDLQMSQDEANRSAAEAMLELQKTLKETGKDWRTTTEDGLAAREALSAAVAALIRQRQANLDAKMSAEDANRQFQLQLETLSKLATAAGISKEALQDLVGDYNINLHLQATGTGFLGSLGRAITSAAQGLSAIGFQGSAGPQLRQGGRFQEFRHGGDPPFGEPFWVGEAGAELMRLTPRPKVFSHQQSTAMAAQGGQTGKALADIAAALTRIETRIDKPATVININAAEGMSPKELSAVVAREMAWNN